MHVSTSRNYHFEIISYSCLSSFNTVIKRGHIITYNCGKLIALTSPASNTLYSNTQRSFRMLTAMLCFSALQTSHFFPCHNVSEHISRRTCRSASLVTHCLPSPLRNVACQLPQDAPSRSQHTPSTSHKTNHDKQTRKKPYGYWKQMHNILRELCAYMASNECADKSTMPTRSQLKQAGRHDLAGAISRTGWSIVAEAANLPLSSIVRPRSLNLVFATRLRLATGRMRPYMYWRDFSHVRKELRQTMRQLNVNYLPSAHCLVQAGRSDLVRAISIHGGWRVVASLMKVECASDRSAAKRSRAQSALLREYVADELERLSLNAEQSSNNVLPTTQLSTLAEGTVLYDTQTQLGGWNEVKDYINSDDASCDIQKLRTQKVKDIICMHISACVNSLCSRDQNRDPKLMPRKSELVALGRNDLVQLVNKLGLVELSGLCGLRKRITKQTVDQAEETWISNWVLQGRDVLDVLRKNMVLPE